MADDPNMQPALKPDVNGPPPARASFDEHPLPAEPDTDVRIVLQDGTELRERLVVIAATAENTLPGAPAAAATTIAYAVSNALLEDGKVARDAEGRPRIASKHEIVFTAEALGRLGTEEAVEAALREAREVAAERARMEFAGQDLATRMLSPRARAGA